MSACLITATALSWCFLGLICWLGWQLLRQNGRILLRLDELEKRLDELKFEEPSSSRREEALTGNSEFRDAKSEIDQSLVTSAATSRSGNRSLARSKIKRDGLKAGTSAPLFQLPRLDGRGELALEELRGCRVLLVFSDPQCGPCNALAPQLEKFHRENGRDNRSPSPQPSPQPTPFPSPGLRPPSPIRWERVAGEGELPRAVRVVMISRGEPKENRVKVKEHGLTFPVVLQQRWEISRLYAMFATPIAYLIDESGIIAHDAAVGVEPILILMTKVNGQRNEQQAALH